MGPLGTNRKPLNVLLLSIITLGIYGLYWQYALFKEMKEHSGQGIGGGVGLILAIFLPFVNIFLLPNEVGGLYRRVGRDAPVSALTAFWNLIPIAGSFIWLWKVQGRLNDYWDTAGSAPVAPAV